MRWLIYLTPEDTKESLNSNSGFQWLVFVIMIVVCFLLVTTGIKAVKTKRLKGKYGRVYEGKTAQVLGGLYAIVGLALPIVAIASKF